MKASIHTPYRKVISVQIDGLFDEDETGYVDPKDDKFLYETVKKFRELLSDNYWEGARVVLYEIINEDFHGPDSSGYPNCCIINIGLYPAMSVEMEMKLEKLVESFTY